MLRKLPLLLLTLVSCVSHDLKDTIDCSTVAISVTLVTSSNVTTCAATDGSISVTASGGEEPYTFRLNDGDFVTSGVFQNLATGIYTVVARDANGCEATLLPSPTITSPGSTLSANLEPVDDTSCMTDNGTITVIASGGAEPYEYKLGNGSFGSNATFSNLTNGNYTITVKDNDGCTFAVPATVARGDTGISWSGEIKNIIDTNCAVSGCHNGSQSPNLSTLSSVQNNKANVKTRTSNGSMPPSGRTPLSDEQKKKIACWVDDGAKNN